MVLGKKILNSVNVVRIGYFVIIFPKEGGGRWPYSWTSSHPLYQRMLWTKFGWNWLLVQEKEIFNFPFVFLLFLYYLPLENDMTIHLNKLDFCPVVLERSWKCEKFTDTRWMDEKQQGVRKAHLSFQLTRATCKNIMAVWKPLNISNVKKHHGFIYSKITKWWFAA